MIICHDSETWSATVGVPGYEVSSLGTVRSIEREVLGRDGRTRTFKGKPIKGTIDKRGYRRVVLYVFGTPIARTVHSLVAEAFIGPCPKGQEVRHKNGEHGDCAATNLEYGTRSENQYDQVRHGRHANARKTTCKRAHPLAEPNLVVSVREGGRRGCRACSCARSYCRDHPELDIDEVAAEYFKRIMEGWL